MKEQIETEIPLEDLNLIVGIDNIKEFEKIINSDDFQKELKSNNIFIKDESQLLYSNFINKDPNHTLGKVLSIDLNKKQAKIRINKDIDLTDKVLGYILEGYEHHNALKNKIVAFSLISNDEKMNMGIITGFSIRKGAM